MALYGIGDFIQHLKDVVGERYIYIILFQEIKNATKINYSITIISNNNSSSTARFIQFQKFKYSKCWACKYEWADYLD